MQNPKMRWQVLKLRAAKHTHPQIYTYLKNLFCIQCIFISNSYVNSNNKKFLWKWLHNATQVPYTLQTPHFKGSALQRE